MKQVGSDTFLRLLSSDVSPEELAKAAKASPRTYVRSLDQLAEFDPSAKGRVLCAFEALESYGKGILREVESEGAALLSESPSAAGRVLHDRREQLKLSQRDVANCADLPLRIVEDAEKSARLPIHEYEKIARVLGLDERFISFKAEPVGNINLAVRLRHIGEDSIRMTPSAVSAISEAAWVALTQIRLESQLGISIPDPGIEPSSNYGAPDYPSYKQGYFLASETRQKLGLGTGPLKVFLRELCEDRLGIPLIQAELGERLAGVTVQVEKRRAIVLNVSGRNRHVYVRRATIAHELGHLLHDVDEKLRDLHVDEYSELEKPAEELPDRVEQRANAFAAVFLAPLDPVLKCFTEAQDDPVGTVMDAFGISHTVARNQIWNAMERKIDPGSLTTSRRGPDPAFEAGEAFTTAYHPIRGIPVSRSGKFSAVVFRAAEEKLISMQTAAVYLNCGETALTDATEAIHSLFPGVFKKSRTGTKKLRVRSKP